MDLNNIHYFLFNFIKILIILFVVNIHMTIIKAFNDLLMETLNLKINFIHLNYLILIINYNH